MLLNSVLGEGLGRVDLKVAGFTRDEQELHAERLRLWREFNVCWLSTLQKQKEMTDAMLRSGQRPAPPQNVLAEDFLEQMGSQLVRLCDGMEQHGLVDYEMGVWEEEIISGALSPIFRPPPHAPRTSFSRCPAGTMGLTILSVLEDCLDLLKGGADTAGQQPAGQSHLQGGGQAPTTVSLGSAP